MVRVKISLSGVLYATAGVLLLISGMLRGALLSAICGSIIVLYVLYAAVAVALTAVLWKAEEPEDGFTVYCSTHTSNTRAGVGALSNNTACTKYEELSVLPTRLHKARMNCQATHTCLPPCIPGTTAFYVMEFAASPQCDAKTVHVISIPLRGAKSADCHETAPRGRYFCKRQHLRIADFAGFFSVHIVHKTGNRQTYTVVQPLIPHKAQHGILLYSYTNTDVVHERTYELYESRPYYPGDDPRKIHWKLYAHTQNLAIKLGAFEPLPIRHVTIYIEEPICMKKKECQPLEKAFDMFIGRLSGFLAVLLAQNFRCTVLLNDYVQHTVAADTTEAKSLQQHEISRHAGEAEIQNLLAIPSLCFSCNDVPEPYAVFNAVPEGSVLLYCYLPQLHSCEISTSHELSHLSIEKSSLHTHFYLASPPQHESNIPIKHSTQVLNRLHTLLYEPTISTREKAFYHALEHAAERDIRILTARGCHAELL